jgi:hypothetical protein
VLINEDRREEFFKIIEEECCWYCEGVCQQMGSCIEKRNVESVLCIHARKWIVPYHPELTGKPTGFKKICRQCKKTFESKSKTKSLCDTCSVSNRKKQIRERVRKYRASKLS